MPDFRQIFRLPREMTINYQVNMQDYNLLINISHSNMLIIEGFQI
jgi:hypothetical protein